MQAKKREEKSLKTIKNLTVVCLAIVLAFVAIPATVVATEQPILVYVEGVRVHFSGQQPVIVDGRTLVPIRGVFEALGFYPTWNGEARQAALSRFPDSIIITIDSNMFLANGTYHALDVPAQLINGSTMVPLRAVLESVGYELDWDDVTRSILVTNNRPTEEAPELPQGTPLAPPAMGGTTVIVNGQQITLEPGETINDAIARLFDDQLPKVAGQKVSEWSTEQMDFVSFEQEVVYLINELRMDRGLQPLVWHDTIAYAARLHSEDIAMNGSGGNPHIGTDGSTVGQRVRRIGIDHNGASENVASISRGLTPNRVVDRWYNSPAGHGQNMLNSNWTHAGVGIGLDENGHGFVTLKVAIVR